MYDSMNKEKRVVQSCHTDLLLQEVPTRHIYVLCGDQNKLGIKNVSDTWFILSVDVLIQALVPEKPLISDYIYGLAEINFLILMAERH